MKSGSWHAINHRYPPIEETRDLFTAWIAHGPAPKAAHYAYLVVPGIDRQDVAAYVSNIPVRLLANQPNLQAVAHDHLGIAAMAFYQPEKISIRPKLAISVDRPCLVLAREINGQLQLTLANPENKATEVEIVISSEQADRRWVVPLPDGPQAGSSVTQTVTDYSKPARTRRSNSRFTLYSAMRFGRFLIDPSQSDIIKPDQIASLRLGMTIHNF